MQKLTWWLVLSYLLICCKSYKILVSFPIPARSHAILGEGIVRNLLKAGHEVTYITSYGYKNPPAKLRQILVSSNTSLLLTDILNVTAIMNKEIEMKDHAMLIIKFLQIMKNTVAHKEVQNLMNDPNEQFDIVVNEWIFSELLAGFAAVFDCPLIWVSTMEVNWMILKLIDKPTNPAYTVDFVTANTPPLNFIQRMYELWIQLKVSFLQYMYFNDIHDKEYERLFAPAIVKRGKQPPPFEELRYNGSLILGNSHVSMGQATNIPQSYKAIGGYHIKEEVKPLSEDLKKIMDNSRNGVIYFSMGSNLKSKDLPKEIKLSLLKMFGTLKQTVLWKFEDVFPNLPSNVHIMKWAPQPSILAHPNCILFITHGGLLSTTEAIHFGVPIIGIPVFADQFMNVMRAIDRGFALRVELSFTMADELTVAIQEITGNPKYTERVKELSFIYHDRPVKPGSELVHWIEHVVRTRGAPHLRSPALRVPLYQRLYLDLLALIAAVLIAILIIIKRICVIVYPNNKVESRKKNS